MKVSLFRTAGFFHGPRGWCLLTLLAVVAAGPTRAQQALPKTSDITEEVSADGSVSMAFQMTFDAAPWRSWKAMVGDEPARMRAMMRHRFAVLNFDDFKLERDDMNRVAKMSLHSAAGPELRDDGSYQVPVDGDFRLINNAGRVWYFSGSNPSAGYTLNNVKVTLPANAVNAYVANPSTRDQALVYALTPPASSSRWFSVAGAVVLGLGLLLGLAGLLWRRRRGVEVLPPPAFPRALSVPRPEAGAPAATPGTPPPFATVPDVTVVPTATVIPTPSQLSTVVPPPGAGSPYAEPD